jgi:hypothetical protein
VDVGGGAGDAKLDGPAADLDGEAAGLVDDGRAGRPVFGVVGAEEDVAGVVAFEEGDYVVSADSNVPEDAVDRELLGALFAVQLGRLCKRLTGQRSQKFMRTSCTNLLTGLNFL